MLSELSNLETILKAVVEMKPKRILDIGSGFGKMGVLIREAILSHWGNNNDFVPKDNLVIDCVEVAKYFHNLPYHQAIYNHHFHDDIGNIEIGEYDLGLLIDVVEHWDTFKFFKTIPKLKEKIKKIIISTPKKVEFYLNSIYGEDCPRHKRQIELSDIYSVNPRAIDISTEKSFIFII